jgi:phosphoribosylformimino-5-aminoimidazole carboxamide ribotide isomerase
MTLFRPCIDIHQGQVKQIVGSTLSEDPSHLQTNFTSERPAEWFAELYAKDELRGGHVIQLGKDPQNQEAALAALRAYPKGLQVGGGIDSSNASRFLEAGASHVIVTSWLFPNDDLEWERLHALVAEVGVEQLVLDLSCRKVGNSWFVATQRWQHITSVEITQEWIQQLEPYCSEFLIHAADVEGKCQGMDEDLLQALGRWVSIPTTYAGGASSIQDLQRVNALSQGKVDLTIGSALDIFGGVGATYKDCVAYNKKS